MAGPANAVSSYPGVPNPFSFRHAGLPGIARIFLRRQPSHEPAFVPLNHRATGRAWRDLRLGRRHRHPRRLRAAVAAAGSERRHAGSFRRTASPAALARRHLHSLLHRADGVADVHCLCGGAAFHVLLRLHRSEERARAQGDAPAARHPAVGARARVSVGHRHRVPGVVPRQSSRRRVRKHIRDLHGAGVEHDVRLLPFADHHSGRPAGSRLGLPDESLAAVHQGRSPVVRDRPHVELDDELRRRLVLRRAKRSHFGVEQEHQAARAGVVHGGGRRSR